MANTKSAKKRIRQTAKRTERNRVYRGSARTFIRKTRSLIEAGQLDEAEVEAKKAYSILDKSARKNVVHRRNAARRKGRLMAQLAAARAKETA
ncbi:MAG: 30S ribosomal protein S20 [Chloroflexi bacterium]|nr:30S ribosomal protein S20 [Chloroflexota bacterium]